MKSVLVVIIIMNIGEAKDDLENIVMEMKMELKMEMNDSLALMERKKWRRPKIQCKESGRAAGAED